MQSQQNFLQYPPNNTNRIIFLESVATIFAVHNLDFQWHLYQLKCVFPSFLYTSQVCLWHFHQQNWIMYELLSENNYIMKIQWSAHFNLSWKNSLSTILAEIWTIMSFDKQHTLLIVHTELPTDKFRLNSWIQE